MDINQARKVAAEHNSNPSSECCLEMGDTLAREGKTDLALRWFVQSLIYSLGPLNPDHVREILGTPTAEACHELGDALLSEGETDLAARWFAHGLAYEVGIFHPDHESAELSRAVS